MNIFKCLSAKVIRSAHKTQEQTWISIGFQSIKVVLTKLWTKFWIYKMDNFRTSCSVTILVFHFSWEFKIGFFFLKKKKFFNCIWKQGLTYKDSNYTDFAKTQGQETGKFQCLLLSRGQYLWGQDATGLFQNMNLCTGNPLYQTWNRVSS